MNDSDKPRWQDEDYNGWLVPPSWRKWLGSATLPLLLIGYAVRCWILQQATIIGHVRGGHTSIGHICGINAIAFGFVFLFLGLFLHFRYFWRVVPKLHPFSYPAADLAFRGFVVSIVCHVCLLLLDIFSKKP